MVDTFSQPRGQLESSAQNTLRLDEDGSPFGVQGLRRDTLQIIKPHCIPRLAIALAFSGSRRRIQDPVFIEELLDNHSEWMETYQVVHLIERSLWIQGQHDLVMTLIENPSQIPDQPPARIRQALANAYARHPQGTIWFGVPLFGAETNSQGLPIPLSAQQVREENQRRIAAAQRHALRWGWVYRILALTLGVGLMFWQMAVAMLQACFRGIATLASYPGRIRRDARKRAEAVHLATMQYYRFGRSWTVVPEHGTLLGRFAVRSFSFLSLARHILAIPSLIASGAALSIGLVNFIPTLVVPLTIVSADPFLFVEVPEEPGKLRHLGHWYWQMNGPGRRKLHLHV